MTNYNYMSKINAIIDRCKFKRAEIAKSLHIDVKTLFNYLYQRKEIPFETLVGLINVINKMLVEYNQKSATKIKYLSLAHFIRLYDTTHTLSDVDLTDIVNKERFLHNIESLENKYDLSLFEETLNSEFAVLRLIFNNINLKDYVAKLNVEFDKIRQLKHYDTENNIEQTMDSIKDLRFNIDRINQEFFQALIDKLLVK